MKAKSSTKRTTLWVCLTAMFMALNVAMSSFGVPVPGGHLYLNEYNHLHRGDNTRSRRGIHSRRSRRIFGRPAVLSGADVRLAGDARTPGDYHLRFFALCSQEASRARERNRRLDRRRYHGRRLFSRQSVYLQHPGIRPYEAAIPVLSGCGRRGSRYAPVLEVRRFTSSITGACKSRRRQQKRAERTCR